MTPTLNIKPHNNKSKHKTIYISIEMPLKNPNERVECPDCNATFPRSQRSWHYKFKTIFFPSL